VTPSTGEPFCEVAYSGPADIELALGAAQAAKDAWGRRSPADRTAVLNAMADAVEQNLEMLAVAESYENGKPVRETLAADIPLSVDHPRYFAGAVRSEEGRISEIDENTYAYHFHEPLSVVGQIIPFNFPLLMAAWKLAPALVAGNCSVIKPASATPWSILKLMEVLAPVVPRTAALQEPPARLASPQLAGLDLAEQPRLAPCLALSLREEPATDAVRGD
jgi:aldehyde dehydrogenase